ncbi:MAG: hypothetical protein COB22_08825 [Cycloclasticus sp.]|nr:MAG: hypothetical protein COB22_08825 [Cycloclasticus sp.]
MIQMRYALLGVAAFGVVTGIGDRSVAAVADGVSRPVLTEFIYQTTEGHPSLLAAEAALRAARARARGRAKPLYNPELEVGYESAEVTTKEIGISQAFDWSGKRGARAAVGRAEVQGAEAQYELAVKFLQTQILQALASFQAARQERALAGERVTLNEKFLSLTERRSHAGDVTRSELLTAELALAEAKATLFEAANALSIAEEQLIAVAGERRQIWPQLTGAPPTTAGSTVEASIEDLAEIRLALAQTEISRAQIRVAKTDRIPDPTVGLRVGEEGRSTLVGLSISMPIPIRNSYRSEVVAAGADLAQAQQGYFYLRQQISARLEATKSRFLAADEAWRSWQAGGAAPLEEQRILLGELLNAREIGALDYLIQLNQTFATETASIELNERLWTAWFDWQDANGSTREWLEKIQ